MPLVEDKDARRLNSLLKSMEKDRVHWWHYWRELAEHTLPRRYRWLHTETEWNRTTSLVNEKIIDGTATKAIKVLASGLMNGITSPARPWFKLSAHGFRQDYQIRRWFDEVNTIMLDAMAETNFYSALAIQYLDLAIFQTSSMLIYEDDEDIFRCYNDAVGEFFLSVDNRGTVSRYARKFTWRIEQVVQEFGLENCSERVQLAYKQGDGRLNDKVTICHMIEPNDENLADFSLDRAMRFREVYWETNKASDKNGCMVLRVRGFYEWPGSVPRWEVVGNEAYGTGPSHDAMGDIRQLQHMTKRKLQGLDKTVSPPLVADIQLQHRPTALLPNGITYVAGANNIGMKPVYTPNIPFQEIAQDIIQLQTRIQETYHTDLFRMISSLETVRSATEIDARREEKLVLLGPVLDRIQREMLAASVKRIFGIMYRGGYFPPIPEKLLGAVPSIEYSSILSDSMRAVGAAPLERVVAFAGNLAGVKPEVMDVFDWDTLIKNYATHLGIASSNLLAPEQVDALRQQRQQAQAMESAAQSAPGVAQSAKLLSETQVGGAASALDIVLGGQG